MQGKQLVVDPLAEFASPFLYAFSQIHIAASSLRFSSFRRQCLLYFACLLSLKFPFLIQPYCFLIESCN